MEKKVIVLFLHASIGELYVALPILWFLKQAEKIDIYFASEYSDVTERLKISDIYINIMNEIGSFHFGKKASFRLLKELRSSNTPVVQMSCYTGMRMIDRLFYLGLKKSFKVFFPHSYTIFPTEAEPGKGKDTLFVKMKQDFENRFGQWSALIVNRTEEKTYFEKLGWKSEYIFSTGALGYLEEWQNKVNSIVKHFPDNNKIKIFVPLKNQNNHAITPENYHYLIDSFAKVFEEFHEYDFFVKLHPRQQNDPHLKTLFTQNNNVTISIESPLELSKKCDLTLGMWTSALVDSISMGTPAIEFYRHENIHPLVLRNQDGKTISYYSKINLVEAFDQEEDVVNFLRELDRQKLEILVNKQKRIFDKIFELNSDESKSKVVDIFQDIFQILNVEDNKIKNEKRIVLNVLFEKIKNYLTRSFLSSSK